MTDDELATKNSCEYCAAHYDEGFRFLFHSETCEYMKRRINEATGMTPNP
jgi:hypothetical protein